jgi:hypothetical protein
MSTKLPPKHWLVRVNDGHNFKNSKYPIWGVKPGNNNQFLSIVQKLRKGDILWFITAKKYGGKAIAMAEYTEYHNRTDEQLFDIHTKSNAEHGWAGDDDYNIQLSYIKLYDIERQNIQVVVQCCATIMSYDTFKGQGFPDLIHHYTNFKFYANPKNIN